jgi:hypothetical protein
MRRHERPRLSNIRVETPVRGKWCKLSLAQKRQHIFDQLKQLGSMKEQPRITCICGKIIPAMYAYRCFECGAFFCPKCASRHFGIKKSKYGSVQQLMVRELIKMLKQCPLKCKVFTTSPDGKNDLEIIGVWVLSKKWVMLKTK